MSSNFERLQKIINQAYDENFSCLFHVEPRNLPRSPYLWPRWSGPFVEKNRRFGIREKHVMNSLQDHPASPGVSKWGCANCSLYWKAKELGESQQNKTPSWSLRLYCLYHQSEKWGRIRAIRMVSTWQGLRMLNEAFFHWNPKLLGLGRQIGQIDYGEFGVFSAKLVSAPILI